MSHCRGFTLVEVLIAMLLGSAALGLLTTTMGAVLRRADSAGNHLEAMTGLARLAEQLRRDVHQASSAQAVSEMHKPDFLKLEGPGGVSLAYHECPGGVLRESVRDEVITARERFALPGLEVAHWKAATVPGEQVVLELDRQAAMGTSSGAQGRFTISANLGANLPNGGAP
ncbi:MAG TPA: prepilin-type N-terminal cleavage/methylation domain-containing protein [Pirellulales bacterium]|jgi:prepilin-type N-terminal cleavage/methylation domain-containing protein|nr:prepilin-type N-terminal cleavage/methylation domain-containing protein [Pirellulales bacterium]